MTSIPDDSPIANWLGDRKSAAMSLVAAMAWVAAILLRAVPMPIGRMLLRLDGSLWNATLSFALMYCLTSFGVLPSYSRLSRVLRRSILGYLSSFWLGVFARTRKVSLRKSVESANGPDDLSRLRRRSVDRRSVSSWRRALTMSLLEVNAC